MGTLIDSLASIGHDSEAIPNSNGVDFVTRNAFRQSVLYRSFLEHRNRRSLDKARAAAGPVRLELLAAAKHLPSLTAGMQETIEAASIIYDQSLPLLQRVQFLERSPAGQAVAMDWGDAPSVDTTTAHGDGARSRGLMWTAATWLTDTPNLKLGSTDLAEYLMLAAAFCHSEAGASLSNEVQHLV